jgi:hypothetical protein
MAQALLQGVFVWRCYTLSNGQCLRPTHNRYQLSIINKTYRHNTWHRTAITKKCGAVIPKSRIE